MAENGEQWKKKKTPNEEILKVKVQTQIYTKVDIDVIKMLIKTKLPTTVYVENTPEQVENPSINRQG